MATSRSRHLMIVAEGRATAKLRRHAGWPSRQCDWRRRRRRDPYCDRRCGYEGDEQVDFALSLRLGHVGPLLLAERVRSSAHVARLSDSRRPLRGRSICPSGRAARVRKNASRSSTGISTKARGTTARQERPPRPAQKIRSHAVSDGASLPCD